VLRRRPEECFPQVYNRLVLDPPTPSMSAFLEQASARRWRPWLRVVNGTRSGSHVRSLSGHDRSVLACQFAAGGAFVVSASADRTVRLWNVADGRELQCVRDVAGPDSAAMPFVVAGERPAVACASEQGDVSIWHAATGAFVSQQHVDGPVRAVALSARGNVLAIVEGGSRRFQLCDAGTDGGSLCFETTGSCQTFALNAAGSMFAAFESGAVGPGAGKRCGPAPGRPTARSSLRRHWTNTSMSGTLRRARSCAATGMTTESWRHVLALRVISRC
jgi:hypothetical protein